jgi:catechol 2,3-dioxygenase-like lactoylglutathione lyase family enzyme
MSTPPNPLFSRLSQFAIASVEPAKLARFYSEVLGLRFAFEVGGMHFLDIGGAHLMIGPKHPDQTVGGDAVFYFEPTAWKATEAALEKAGVAFMNPTIVLQKAEGRELGLRAFKDPEGHTLAMFGWRDAA